LPLWLFRQFFYRAALGLDLDRKRAIMDNSRRAAGSIMLRKANMVSTHSEAITNNNAAQARVRLRKLRSRPLRDAVLSRSQWLCRNMAAASSPDIRAKAINSQRQDHMAQRAAAQCPQRGVVRSKQML